MIQLYWFPFNFAPKLCTQHDGHDGDGDDGDDNRQEEEGKKVVTIEKAKMPPLEFFSEIHKPFLNFIPNAQSVLESAVTLWLLCTFEWTQFF